MNKRLVTLLSFMGCLGVVYVWFFLIPSGGELQAVTLDRPPRPVTFVFNRDEVLQEVKVTFFDPGPAGTEGQGFERVVWHLVASGEEQGAREQVIYGRGIKGMKPAEGMPAKVERLQPGGKYRLDVQTQDGDNVQIEFSPKG